MKTIKDKELEKLAKQMGKKIAIPIAELINQGWEMHKKHVLGYLKKEIKELKEIDSKIPDKFKKLETDETNQHMRIQASLSIAEELKSKIQE